MRETMQRDGRTWYRWVYSDKPDPFWQEDRDGQELKCGCWVDAGFNVTYGQYEAIGECRACGKKSTIYQE